jgi:hypothetical protein
LSREDAVTDSADDGPVAVMVVAPASAPTPRLSWPFTTRMPSIDVPVTGPVAVMFANPDPILATSSPKNPPVNDAV